MQLGIAEKKRSLKLWLLSLFKILRFSLKDAFSFPCRCIQTAVNEVLFFPFIFIDACVDFKEGLGRFCR